MIKKNLYTTKSRVQTYIIKFNLIILLFINYISLMDCKMLIDLNMLI